MYTSNPEGTSARYAPRHPCRSRPSIHSIIDGTKRNIPTLRVAEANPAITHASSRFLLTLSAHTEPADSAKNTLSV